VYSHSLTCQYIWKNEKPREGNQVIKEVDEEGKKGNEGTERRGEECRDRKIKNSAQ
jgi:hypothetical protein